MNAIAVAAGALLLVVAVLGIVVHMLDARRQWLLAAAALAPWLMAAAIPGTALFVAYRVARIGPPRSRRPDRVVKPQRSPSYGV